MKINNQNKKRYMLLLFAMIVMLLVFKIIYIRREYIDLNTDYSVYVVMFMPFAIFYALKYMDNITSVPALNWICTVPMSMYLYQSRYLRFKQLVMKNGRRFYISSRNVTEVKNRFKTTKCSDFEDLIPENNKVGHGYGLLNIHEIVKKNNGKIDFLLLDSDKVKVTFRIKKLMTKSRRIWQDC